MSAPTSYDYSTVSAYITEGIIFAYSGCRGRYTGKEDYVAGAPWCVTDLKSAIRYLRYNKEILPGDTDKIYTFGMSGGGAQSCLMGVTGNSDLYTKYLEENGAAMKDAAGNKIKDNVKGSQCWCPITNLDTANAAYEWNIGQYFSTDTRTPDTFTKSLSDDLTKKFVEYVNDIRLKDPKGNVLTLTETNKGSYYDYLKTVIEQSLNNFISDTSFPWTKVAQKEFPRFDDFGDSPPLGPGGPEDSGDSGESTTYETLEEYIASLNSDKKWVTYDSKTNTATITSVEDFVKKCKNPSKDVGAFDDLKRAQGENQVFGTNYDTDNNKMHFDEMTYNLLNDNNDKYKALSDYANYINDFSNDLYKVDSVGKNVLDRVNMYNPMYYLSDHYNGYKTSDVADYFRINTGIFQSDTGNVVEINLYLALMNYGKNVQFTSVWEQQHVKAERTGDSDANFIQWINEIEKTNAPNFSKDINISYLVILVSLFFLF